MSHNMICNDPECFNHDEGTLQFCPDCLNLIADKMSMEDMYDIYVDCENKLKGIIKTRTDVDTPEAIAEGKLCCNRLFDTINELMLLKKRK